MSGQKRRRFSIFSALGGRGGDRTRAAASSDSASAELERITVHKANQALAKGNFVEAARSYSKAAELVPHRADYKMMAGHCLKDGKDFAGAFRFYAAAWTQAPSADAYVQLGHLFKITGNIDEAERFYRMSARLGEPTAMPELDNLASFGPSQLAWLPPARRPDDAPLESIWTVIASGRSARLDHDAILAAGKTLALYGVRDVAKAFLEMAYLSDPRGAHSQEHVSLVRKTGIWPPEHPAELIRASAFRTDRATTSGRQRMQRLMASMAQTPAPQPAFQRADIEPVSLPRVLTIDDCEDTLRPLCDAVDRVYRAFAIEAPISGAAAIDAVRGLDAVVSRERIVTFPTGATTADLRLIAAGALPVLIRSWLRNRGESLLGPHASAEQVAAEIATGGNPLAELVGEFVSAAAALNEIARLLPRGPETEESPGQRLDRFACRLAATGAWALSDAQFEDFVQESIARNLTKTLAVLCGILTTTEAPGEKIIHYAQTFKTAGLPALAYELLNAGLDEKLAKKDHLIEKAIVAKINGDFAAAARLFETVAERDSGDVFSRRELAAILPEVEALPRIAERCKADPLFLTLARERPYLRRAIDDDRLSLDDTLLDDGVRLVDLAPEIVEEFTARPEPTLREEIDVLDLGRHRRRGAHGDLIVLYPLDFVRARISSFAEIVRVRIRLDGRTVCIVTPTPLSSGASTDPIWSYVINCWLDLSGVAGGAHELQVYCEERKGGHRSTERSVWIDPSPATLPENPSASIFALPPGAEGVTVEDRVNSLPTLVLDAERNFFQGEFRNVLVMRADQLGDFALSLPALFELRGLFPEASLTCLVSPANRDFAESTGLFSETLTVDTAYEPARRRRTVSVIEQIRLRKALQAKPFDLAIDLSAGGDARPLLRLAGARYTAGFCPKEFPWLSFGIELDTRDGGNGREASPHSARPLALVRALAGVMRQKPFRLPSPNADRKQLLEFGLDPDRGFAALHTGARTSSRKWPLENYLALAERLIRERELQVAVFVDSTAELNEFDQPALRHPDVHLIARRLPFQQLDALVSTCDVFVGNDSGPKHLASVRGVPVVSIHMGAVNWREWGQETGLIVTRRTPCYGCGIELVEECGKGAPCLFRISVEDVFGAVERALRMRASPPVRQREEPPAAEAPIDSRAE